MLWEAAMLWERAMLAIQPYLSAAWLPPTTTLVGLLLAQFI